VGKKKDEANPTLANLSAIQDQLRIASYRKNLQQEQVKDMLRKYDDTAMMS